MPAASENSPPTETQPKTQPSPSDRPAASSPPPVQTQHALQPLQGVPQPPVEPDAAKSVEAETPETTEPRPAEPTPTAPIQPLSPVTPQPQPTSSDDPFAPPPPKSAAAPTNRIPPPATPVVPAPAPVDDDPFAPVKPATRPAPSPATAAPAAPDLDDPFAPAKPKSAAPAEKRQAVTPPAKKTAAPLADSLQLATDGRLPVRQWTDNSGSFKVQARLLLILDGKIRLLKETGRTTTVSIERLSAADREYVEAIIARYGKDLSQLDQLAAN